MFLWIALVVDENTEQKSIRTPVGDMKGQIAADRREPARLHDAGENIGTDLRQPVPQFAQT